MDFIDLFLNLDKYLDLLVNDYGPWVYWILALVIFCETGLVIMPFLPGDTLLFIAGAIAGQGKMNVHQLALMLMVAAILGDSTNYVIGRYLGMRLFSNPKSRIFRRDYLEQAQTFYRNHGGKTVILARFVPVVRTFAPFVAGMGTMYYPRFLAFSVIGAIVWAGGLVYLGYWFGNIPWIRDNLSSVLILGVCAVPVMGVMMKYWKARQPKAA